MADHRHIQRETLLQEGVSCALATLNAIEGADLFRMLPADAGAAKLHGHGSWLIGMLQDHLTRIQQQVDALDAVDVARVAQAEG